MANKDKCTKTYSLLASTTKGIILPGKNGSGKGNLTNTIIGEDELFITNNSPNSGTEQEIMSCITECAPGPHVFLIVLKLDKFSELEQDVINKIFQRFTENALKYAVIVFTHSNLLPEGKTIQEFVSKNKNLSNVVKMCGGRCHFYDNKYWKNQQNQEPNYMSNELQVEELLSTIDKMVMKNSGDYYTNAMLQVVEEEITTEEHRLKQSLVNQSEEETKANVSKRVLTGLTAAEIGALLGAIFDVKDMVGLVMTVVPNKALRNISSQVCVCV